MTCLEKIPKYFGSHMAIEFSARSFTYMTIWLLVVNLYSNKIHYRCTKDDPVPVENGIPLVEFHAGGMGDNQVRLLNN